VKRPTQNDVARLAGVSRATVSFVLNEHTGGRISISDVTRQRVIEVAEQLGYMPNALARSLKSGSSGLVGFLIPSLHNPHYYQMIEGVKNGLSEKGYGLELVTSDHDPERERYCLQSLFQQRLDGLILIPTFIDQIADELKMLYERKSSIAFIMAFEGADWVIPEIRSGAEYMMDHLLSLGHRRIAFINGVVRRKLSLGREEIYLQKIMSAGSSFDPNLLRHCGYQINDAYLETQQLLQLPNPPTAIWTINDLLAIGALRAIGERGLRIPQDIALAGFDDIDLAKDLYPPLTTVRIPSQALGSRAVEILFKRINDPNCELMQETLPVELVIRQSTIGT
jgi:LacI family transcriptional regulator